jgi:hypothetical protein
MKFKCLSVQQPWAYYIFRGKPIENRKWFSNYAGVLLIHASKTFDYEGYGWICNNKEFLGLKDIPDVSEFMKGGIIGKVEMTDCVKFHYSKWFCGPFAFVFTNPKETKFFECKGQLGIFEIDMPKEFLIKDNR